MHMSACELRDYATVRRARVSPDGSASSSVASNRHTTGCIQSHTPTFVMWVLWWGLVPGGITSAAPLQYPQRTDVRPHQAGGMHSLWHGPGQGFTEHICWWNKHRGERKIPHPKPRGFTPHSPALSTFRPPNNPRKCQTPVSQPKAYKSRRHMACNSLLSSQLFSCFKENQL